VTTRGHLHRFGAAVRARPWLEYLVLLVLSASLVLAIAMVVDLKTVGTAAFADPGWDRHFYVEMARRTPGDFHIAPYQWRVLVPALAGAQPWSLQSGFLSVTCLSLAATGPALYWLIRGADGTRPAALAVLILYYSLGWGPRFLVSDFWVPDAAAVLFTVLAMGAVVRKQWAGAAVVLAVGVLAKESVLFVVPLAYTWHARRVLDWPAARTAALVAIPAMLVFIAVRALISVGNDDPGYVASLPPEISRFPEIVASYTYPDRFEDVAIDQRWRGREWDDANRYVVEPCGLAVVVLAVGGAIADWRRALRVAPFIALVYAQLLFATDTQRLLVLAFPALALLFPPFFEFASRRGNIPQLAWPAMAAALFLLGLRAGNRFTARDSEQLLVVGLALGMAVGVSRLSSRLRALR